MIDASNVREGMDVLDVNGEKIGSVAAVRATMIGGSGLDTGGMIDVDAGTTPNTYVEVRNHGTIWVPVNQVASVGEDGVHLDCERFACEERYNEEPPGLE